MCLAYTNIMLDHNHTYQFKLKECVPDFGISISWLQTIEHNSHHCYCQELVDKYIIIATVFRYYIIAR